MQCIEGWMYSNTIVKDNVSHLYTHCTLNAKGTRNDHRRQYILLNSLESQGTDSIKKKTPHLRILYFKNTKRWHHLRAKEPLQRS